MGLDAKLKKLQDAAKMRQKVKLHLGSFNVYSQDSNEYTECSIIIKGNCLPAYKDMCEGFGKSAFFEKAKTLQGDRIEPLFPFNYGELKEQRTKPSTGVLIKTYAAGMPVRTLAKKAASVLRSEGDFRS